MDITSAIIWVIFTVGFFICVKIVLVFFKIITSIDMQPIDNVKEHDDAFVQMPDGTIRYDEGSLL